MSPLNKARSRTSAWLSAVMGIQGIVCVLWLLYKQSLLATQVYPLYWLTLMLLGLGSLTLLAWAITAHTANRFTHWFWKQIQWLCKHFYPWVFASALASFIIISSLIILHFSDKDPLLNSLAPVLSTFFFLILLDLIIVYILRVKKPHLRGGDKALRIALLALVSVWLLAFFTRLGLAPDKWFWNVAGVPVLLNQAAAILLAALLGEQLLKWATKKVRGKPGLQKGLLVLTCFLIWFLTACFWLSAPIAETVFVEGPWLPNQDYVPHSDAAIIDLGAQYMIIGEGLEKTLFTDKPLYTFFLGVLHSLSGESYLKTTNLQILVLALLPVLLYLFGRQLGGDFLGFAAAGFGTVKEFNAIFGMWQISVSNSRLYMSELPLTLLLVAFAFHLFRWFSKAETPGKAPLIAGGLLGFATMVRTNPVIFLLLVPLFALAVYRACIRNWWPTIRLFLLGLLLAIGPWLLYNQIRYGANPIYYKIDSVVRTRVLQQPQQMAPTGMWVEAPLLFTNYRETLFDERVETEETLPEIPPSNQNSAETVPPAESTPTLQLPLIASTPASDTDAGLETFSVLNLAGHFLNNQIKSLFILPFQAYPLELAPVLNLPYWKEPILWDGDLPFDHSLAFGVNLLLIALGLSYAWQSFSWAGLVPLLINIGYFTANALGRTSGSRYLLPADWTVWLYWLLGIYAILASFRSPLKTLPLSEYHRGKKSTWSIALVLFLAGALLPIVNLAYPKLYTQTDKFENFKRLPLDLVYEEIELTPERVENLLMKPGSEVVYGKMIYLRYGDNWLTNSRGYIFEVLSPGFTEVFLPTYEPPLEPIPSGEDVVAIGCKRAGYLEAYLAYLPSQNRLLHLGFPWEDSFCDTP